MKYIFFGSIMSLFFFSSCVSEPSTCEVINQVLTGSMQGTSWTAGEASARVVTEDGVDKFDIVIFDSASAITDVCAQAELTRIITLKVPVIEDNYPLKLDLNATDNQTVTIKGVNNDDLITTGCVEVVSSTNTDVVIIMNLFNANNAIEGNLTIARCN